MPPSLLAIYGFFKTRIGKAVGIVGLILVALGTAYFKGRAKGGQNQRDKDRRNLERAVKERDKDAANIRRLPDDDLDKRLRDQQDEYRRRVR
jgi:hypothetical protein